MRTVSGKRKKNLEEPNQETFLTVPEGLKADDGKNQPLFDSCKPLSTTRGRGGDTRVAGKGIQETSGSLTS